VDDVRDSRQVESWKGKSDLEKSIVKNGQQMILKKFIQSTKEKEKVGAVKAVSERSSFPHY
jgi:hypothetical protein